MKPIHPCPNKDDQIRCPRLGHVISFSYCRSENMGLPCSKALNCWHGHFLVEEFFRKELTPEQWDNVFGRLPKSKLLSLIEMVEGAKKRVKEEG